jgi:hypothetical protein
MTLPQILPGIEHSCIVTDCNDADDPGSEHPQVPDKEETSTSRRIRRIFSWHSGRDADGVASAAEGLTGPGGDTD